MAHDALHVLLLEELLARQDLDPHIGDVLRRGWRWAALGSVLVDLPYFGGFLGQVVREARGASGAPSPWGDRFHRGFALRLARELLCARAEAPPGVDFAALALGHLTHVALDVATHPLVNRLAEAEHARTGGSPEVIHRRVENVQVELWHREHRGSRLFGTLAIARLVGVRGDLLAGGPAWAAMELLLRRALADSPSVGDWRRWTLGLWEYAAAVASPLGRVYLPEAEVDSRGGWYRQGELSFPQVFEGAVSRAAADLGDALDLMDRPGGLELQSFYRRFPEIDLDHPSRPIGGSGPNP